MTWPKSTMGQKKKVKLACFPFPLALVLCPVFHRPVRVGDGVLAVRLVRLLVVAQADGKSHPDGKGSTAIGVRTSFRFAENLLCQRSNASPGRGSISSQIR
jgi:hypothetical protein